MSATRTPKAAIVTRPFVLAFVAHFLHCLAFNLSLHLPGFLQRLGAREVEIGVVFGVTAFTAIVTRPLLGRLIDRHGRRLIVIGGGVLHVLACVLYLSVSSLGPWLYVVRILHGLAEAALFAALFTFAADITPASRRIEGLAIFGVSGMLPMSLSGLLGDAILARAGYPQLFIAGFAAALAATVASLFLVDPPKPVHALPARRLFEAAKQRDLMPLWVVGTAFALALASYFTFMKTFVLDRGVGSVGLFFTTYSLAAVVLRLLLGSLPERVGPQRVLYPAMMSLMAGLAMLASASTGLEVGLAGVLCGLGHGFTYPILLGLVVMRARSSERGAAMALFTAVFDLGTLVGGPAFGAVVRATSYRTMFLSACVLVGVGALAFAVLDRGAGEARRQSTRA